MIKWIYNKLANSQLLYDLVCDFLEDAGFGDEETDNIVNESNIPDRRRRRARKQRRPRKARSARRRRK